MIKILLILTALFFTACVNQRGISTSYYNDCREYYDLQGFYHKDCKEELVTYKRMRENAKKVIKKIKGEKQEKVKGNVW